MGKLKIPSLQHLARNWQPDSQRVARGLVSLTKGGPTFSYEPLFNVVRDLLLFNVPYDQVVEGIRRIPRQDVRENFLGLMPLVKKHFDGASATFVHSVAPRYYSVGRGLMIPFNPPLIYGCGGEIHFPWFSFWRSNPLAGERLALFVTIVEEILLQDSDLEEAKFSILDFSAPSKDEPRELQVIDASVVPRVSPDRKAEMLSTFAEGYRLAEAEVARTRATESREERDVDANQLSLIP